MHNLAKRLPEIGNNGGHYKKNVNLSISWSIFNINIKTSPEVILIYVFPLNNIILVLVILILCFKNNVSHWIMLITFDKKASRALNVITMLCLLIINLI